MWRPRVQRASPLVTAGPKRPSDPLPLSPMRNMTPLGRDLEPYLFGSDLYVSGTRPESETKYDVYVSLQAPAFKSRWDANNPYKLPNMYTQGQHGRRLE